MKVIFLKNLRDVGKISDVKDVNDGYALNFLIPQGIAVQATDDRLTKLDQELKASAKETEAARAHISEVLRSLSGKAIELSARANERGHLFKGLSKEDIARAIAANTAAAIEPSMIANVETPLKDVGEYNIRVTAAGAEAAVTIAVKAA